MTAPQTAPLAPAAKTVVVIGTGGTIAQAGSREATVPVEALVRSATGANPALAVRTEQAFQIPSPDITPSHWATLVGHVRRALAEEDIVGVVVTHGTDTLEETAYFLDLVLGDGKPVVVVGSMRSSDSPEADGPSNLRDAIALAGAADARDRGVLVTLGGRIDTARDVTKTHTRALGAFTSPNRRALGTVRDSHVRFDVPPPETARKAPFAAYQGQTLPQVEIVYGYAGIGPGSLDALALSSCKGIVFAGTGDGSIPSALLPSVQRLRSSGIAIVRSSRTHAGAVGRNGEVDDDQFGLIASHTLNPQKARVLLMLSLWAGLDLDATQALFADENSRL